jgi:hypothetical protein
MVPPDLGERQASVRACPRTGSFRLYKPYQPELLRRLYSNAVTAERHAGPVEAAATLLSYGIVLHPFENANHRTFLAIARLYLTENGFRLPRGGARSAWGKSATQFIRRSKRIRLELSEVACPGADLFETVADKHEKMTSRWLTKVLKGQSGRSTMDDKSSIRSLITRGESSG